MTPSDPSERERRHFNLVVPTCRHSGQRPALNYEPGCWSIACGDTCRCQIHDGDHATPTRLLLLWKAEKRGGG